MRNRPSFTRIELAIVVAITAILVALLLPAVQRLREASHRKNCVENLRKLGGACQSYHQLHRKLPPGGSQKASAKSACLEPECRDSEWSWAYHLLPHLGHTDVYKNPDASAVQGAAIPNYHCPSRRRPHLQNGRGMLDYAGNAGTMPSGANGAIMRTTEGQISFDDIKDGLASTVLVGEKRLNIAEFGNNPGDREGFATPGWTENFEAHRFGTSVPAADINSPGDFAIFAEFGSSHPGVLNALFADGSVRTIRFTINPATWRRACVRNDNETFNLNDL